MSIYGRGPPTTKPATTLFFLEREARAVEEESVEGLKEWEEVKRRRKRRSQRASHLRTL